MHLRLNATFLAVLAVSILGTALAAWAITFASSHARVIAMSAEFTALGEATVGHVNDLVQALLQNSSAIVNYVLTLETEAGVRRINTTQEQVAQTSLQLMAFANISSAEAATQMQAMVTDVGGLIGAIIADFEAIAGQYAVELRYEFAMKVQATFQQWVESGANALLRLPTLLSWNVVGPSKPLEAPIGLDDLTILAALCMYANEIGPAEDLEWVSITGRFYDCTPGAGGTILTTVVDPVTNTYNQTFTQWYPPPSLDPTATDWLAHFQTASPIFKPIGTNCPWPPGCAPMCGYNAWCRPQIHPWLTRTAPQLVTSPVFLHQFQHVPLSMMTWGIRNASAVAPPLFDVVVTFSFFLSRVDEFLAAISVPPGTHLAVLLNDDILTMLGMVGVQCGTNVTQPGPSDVASYSVLRSCDDRVRALGDWLFPRRGAVGSLTNITLNDTVWDVFFSTVYDVSYYVVVGMELSATYGSIWASEADATAALGNLSTTQMGDLAALGAGTRAYMQTLPSQNLDQLQAMRATLMAELATLATSSTALLNSSQAASAATNEEMMQQQLARVNAVQATQLSALAITTAWTIGVVAAIILGALLVASLGTTRLTGSLTEIIALMESVAAMQLEDLTVPQDSPVVEVARIQRAFRVLVARLAEYKTYMPAALFNPRGSADAAAKGEGPDQCEEASESTDAHEGVSISASSRTPSKTWAVSAHPTDRMTSRKVTVLVANVLRFRDHLDTDERLVAHFTAYLKAVHDATAKARGNLDCVVGDQLLVTFNAYTACGDPIATAANAALDVQAALARAGCPLRVQIGLAAGPVLAGSVGYSRFRAMVSLGPATKQASLLAHLSQFQGGAILCDPSIADCIRYTHDLRVVDLVHYPREKGGPRGRAVHLLTGRRKLETDEWMYQIGANVTDWETSFEGLRDARNEKEARKVLHDYLEQHPGDVWALRLRSRLVAWVPGLGIPLHEGADGADAGPGAPVLPTTPGDLFRPGGGRGSPDPHPPGLVDDVYLCAPVSPDSASRVSLPAEGSPSI